MSWEITHKTLNISNITKIILNMFYLSPDDIKSDMKLLFADHFPLVLVLGLKMTLKVTILTVIMRLNMHKKLYSPFLS